MCVGRAQGQAQCQGRGRGPCGRLSLNARRAAGTCASLRGECSRLRTNRYLRINNSFLSYSRELKSVRFRDSLHMTSLPRSSSVTSHSTSTSPDFPSLADSTPLPTHVSMPSTPSTPSVPPSLVVFSGGTAFNSVASSIQTSFTSRVSYVLPVSDDGGSTAEIVRVLGGPAVGDIRSRCLRLSDESTAESRAVKRLLGHRLHKFDPVAAKNEWHEILELESYLWEGVSEPYKHTIKAFLVQFQAQLLRLSPSDFTHITHDSQNSTTSRFCFTNGSVGNFFFAGARIFFRSLDAAIFLYSRVSGIPSESFVLPVISSGVDYYSGERIMLGAELKDGSIIRGQNNISHPSNHVNHQKEDNNEENNFKGSIHTSVNKSAQSSSPLPFPIRRVLYLSNESGSGNGVNGASGSRSWSGIGKPHEVFPLVNQQVIRNIYESDCIIYGMGSLYTSICPSLILEGIGEAVSERKDVPKILILNGSEDRETRGMTAVEIVVAIQSALNRNWNMTKDKGRLKQYRSEDVGESRTGSGSDLREDEITSLSFGVSSYMTTLLYPRGCEHTVNRTELHEIGISQNNVIEVSSKVSDSGSIVYNCEALVDTIRGICEKVATPTTISIPR